MNNFINEKTNMISIWTKGNKELQQKYPICKNNIMLGNFIYQIEKIVNNKNIKKTLEITRIVCGNKILKEEIIII